MLFKGFPEKAFQFLFELGVNNDREWFQRHKEDYKQAVLKPFQDLVIDLGAKMLKIDPEFQITPSVDKTISRIYRDTRFSKDKTPYRNNVWITFKKNIKDWKEIPAFFFEIYPDYYHFGMGFFVFSLETREKLKKCILKNPKEFEKAIEFIYKNEFYHIGGEKFKRAKNSLLPDHLKEWVDRKSLYLYCRKDIDDTLFSGKLVDFIYDNFLLTKPLYDYLWKVIKEN